MSSWFGASSAWPELCVLARRLAGSIHWAIKILNKELAVLLFKNNTSQMTSLTVSWLLVILNH